MAPPINTWFAVTVAGGVFSVFNQLPRASALPIHVPSVVRSRGLGCLGLHSPPHVWALRVQPRDLQGRDGGARHRLGDSPPPRRPGHGTGLGVG